MEEINAKEAKAITIKNKKLADDSDKNILQILREKTSAAIKKAAGNGYFAIDVDCNINVPNIESIVKDLTGELVKRGFSAWRKDPKLLTIRIEWKYPY